MQRLRTLALLAILAGCAADPTTDTIEPNLAVVTFQPLRAYAVQPGWVRATFLASAPSIDVAYEAQVKCESGDPASVTARARELSPTLVAVDVRADLDWLQQNGLPTPCEVSSVHVDAVLPNGPGQPTGQVVGSATLEQRFTMDVPISHLVPRSLEISFSADPISLQPPITSRRYQAYPPLIIAVASASNRTAFLEVEELPARRTLGLRALVTFSRFQFQYSLARELGGGAEIFPGWGVDIDGLGVTRETSGVEESHPGHDAFAYDGRVVPAVYDGKQDLKIFPAPPLFDENTYLANVLDNRGVPRCRDPHGCLDVVYDADAHLLRPVNGATIAWIEGPPIPSGPQDQAPWHGSPDELPHDPSTPVPPPLGTSVAEFSVPGVVFAPPPSDDQDPQSDDDPPPGDDHGGTSGCPLKGVTTSTKLTHCLGYHAAGFSCPTVADPLRVETLPVSDDDDQLSLSSLMPQYMGRSNYFGSCGTHMWVQYDEYLVNKLGRDLVGPRVIKLDNDVIPIPDPLIAFSVGGNLALGDSWAGTRAGDPDLDGPPPANPPEFHATPSVVNAYWPAYEGDWKAWAASTPSDPRAQQALAHCKDKGFWFSAFCKGMGQPPPGVYWNYSAQVASVGQDPLRDVPWSLASTYFDTKLDHIPLADRDAAIRAVIRSLREGLPVAVSFKAHSESIDDGAGGKISLLGDMSWYIPPELAGCDRATIDAAFKPSDGHLVNIIGYSIAGRADDPDPLQSYFIIDNSWSKNGGHGGYYTMSFAFFKLRARHLDTYRLVCPSSYASNACAKG